jgi:hypothetical protein
MSRGSLKPIRSFAGLLAVALAGGGTAACERQHPRIDPSAVTTTSLSLSSVSPGPGEAVGPRTVILADLDYSVAGFVPGQYFLIAQVETKEPGRSTDGDFPSQYPELKAAKGRQRFSFPLKYVWDHPEVKRPFVVWFYLNRKTAPHRSTVVAKAGPLTFGTP